MVHSFHISEFFCCIAEQLTVLMTIEKKEKMPCISIPDSHRYSLHQIHDGKLGFSPRLYSRFKFGDGAAAEELGRDLADGFIQANLTGGPIPSFIVAVSYERVPTAAFYLRRYFVRHLNRWLLEGGHPPCQEIQIQRRTTFYKDFGLMSAEERTKNMSNDQFYIDVGALVGKSLIILDDIRITGAHETRMAQMIEDLQIPNETFFVYLAELRSRHIDPTIENMLNFYAVGTLGDMIALAQSSRFSINARFVKHILSQPGDDFDEFMAFQDERFREVFARAADDNGYWRVSKYVANLHRLEGFTGAASDSPLLQHQVHGKIALGDVNA